MGIQNVMYTHIENRPQINTYFEGILISPVQLLYIILIVKLEVTLHRSDKILFTCDNKFLMETYNCSTFSLNCWLLYFAGLEIHILSEISPLISSWFFYLLYCRGNSIS